MDTVMRSKIERALATGLRATVAVHGPLTFENLGLAARRAADEVLGVLAEMGAVPVPDTTADLDLEALDLRLEELDLQPARS